MPGPGTAPRDTGRELSPDLCSHLRSGPVLPSGIRVEGSASELSLPGLLRGSLELAQVTVCSPTYPHRSSNFRSPGIGLLLGGCRAGTERRVL